MASNTCQSANCYLTILEKERKKVVSAIKVAARVLDLNDAILWMRNKANSLICYKNAFISR